jgi:hypothetical protein
MKHRLTLAGLLLTAGALIAAAPQQGSPTKEALQELQEYIGGWKGSGTSERDKSAIWKENADWGWRFKGDDAWFAVSFKDSKFYKTGELRYLADKMVFELTITDKADKKLVFTGTLKKGYLTLERMDADTKETQQIKINTAAGGDRLIVNYAIKPENRTVFNKEWQIAFNREGTSIAGGKKGPECVVTGGLGTMTVSYKGQTYYVCCTGCRDAFNENPAKIIKEYEDRKKKG